MMQAAPPRPLPNGSPPQDNFEWNAGYLMEFGLYAWRPDLSVDRKLKEGSKMLVRWRGGGRAARSRAPAGSSSLPSCAARSRPR